MMRLHAAFLSKPCKAAVLAATLLSTPFSVQAQQDFTRPITLIVPFPAGGPSDVLARILVDDLRKSLGQPIIVENITGASGSIGMARLARAAPDGYVIGIGNWATHVANGATLPLQYNLVKDFSPIALLSNEPLMLAAKKSIPAKNLREFIEWLRANPNKASSSTSGIGGPSHFAALAFAKQTQTQLTVVPYRGAGPAMLDLVAGQVDMMFAGPSVSLAHMRQGNIKIYAVAAPARSSSYPDIPTMDEAGLPGFHVSVWQALWAPKGTPAIVIAKLNAAVRHALADSTVRQRYAELSLELPSNDQQSPEILAALQRSEIERWWPVIKSTLVKPE